MERLYKYIEITDLKDMLKKSGQKYGKNIAYKIRKEEGKYKIDLWETNRRLLAEMGVENIEISGLCTMCDTQRFYSHRKMRENRGVMAGVMTLL